jgi:hypothetical protein
MREFIGEKAPDATALSHFRRLLKENGPGWMMFEAINLAQENAARLYAAAA